MQKEINNNIEGKNVHNQELLELQRKRNELLKKFRSIPEDDVEARKEVYKELDDLKNKITKKRRSLFKKKEEG